MAHLNIIAGEMVLTSVAVPQRILLPAQLCFPLGTLISSHRTPDLLSQVLHTMEMTTVPRQAKRKNRHTTKARVFLIP